MIAPAAIAMPYGIFFAVVIDGGKGRPRSVTRRDFQRMAR